MGGGLKKAKVKSENINAERASFRSAAAGHTGTPSPAAALRSVSGRRSRDVDGLLAAPSPQGSGNVAAAAETVEAAAAAAAAAVPADAAVRKPRAVVSRPRLAPAAPADAPRAAPWGGASPPAVAPRARGRRVSSDVVALLADDASGATPPPQLAQPRGAVGAGGDSGGGGGGSRGKRARPLQRGGDEPVQPPAPAFRVELLSSAGRRRSPANAARRPPPQ